ncbi:sterol desaturase family protein [Aquabacterium sp.]|uniref:sterol desaturase family protein n=1 Tax=Aquabacterium sp. TaxID=1872578 RepID=UPI002B90D0BE|nr:sterol desaturase family protein [Aquabacterium sp.]HSW05589.1 sterol desaturase family protein [Aquabacterium sp.]
MSLSPLDWFGDLQQALFEGVVQPVMFETGLGNLLEDGFDATGWLLVGLIQIAVMLTLMRALERWRPAEAVTDRAAVRTDVLYTLIHRLGLFRVLLFFSIDPLWDALVGQARLQGWSGLDLDRLWPGVTDIAVLSFVLYLLLFDLVDYGFHRAQHHFHWWWQLHALHHSQRQMTLWSDNRNHLLDDLLRDSLFVLVAQLIGVPPGQFVALVAVTQLIESLSHANVKLDFGRLGSRLLVSPRYHRLHHGIGVGHESQGQGTLGGHNFAVLFPVWDLLFGTARYDGLDHPTGIRDQLPDQGGRDYGRGFWSQQWLGLKRLARRA